MPGSRLAFHGGQYRSWVGPRRTVTVANEEFVPGSDPVAPWWKGGGWRKGLARPNLKAVSQSTIAPSAGAARGAPSSADFAMRRLLRIPQGPPSADEASAHRLFSASILISAVRCLLGYVVLPILTPVLGVAAGAAPAIGLPIGLLASRSTYVGSAASGLPTTVGDGRSQAFTSAVMVLVTILVVSDITHLAR